VLSQNKKTVTMAVNLPPHLKNVSALPCKMQNMVIRLKVYCFLPRGGGSENNRLWCVATWMSEKQRHSKCSK